MNEARLPGQQSVQRAVDVLFCFDTSVHALTAAEIAHQLGLNRTTAWRYLQTLSSSGLVRELGDGRFGLGARTVALAEAYTSQWGELEAVAVPALFQLRDEVGETSALHLRQGSWRVVARQVESHYELHRTYRDLGRPIPLTAGAPSRAMLAAFPVHEYDAYLATLESTERGTVDRAIAEARRVGYAHTRGSRVRGVSSVAAAIRNPVGYVVAAVNVTGPDERLPDERIDEVAHVVTTAATHIESELATPHRSTSHIVRR